MMRYLVLICALTFTASVSADSPEGIRPVGDDGKPLNLDFETGDLRDWTATGDAFKGQPIKGDTVNPRRGDMKSDHQGQYWIGTYERAGDPPQGTLTSVPFRVTHPWASFLVGGGPWPETCVEIILKDSNKLIARVSGIEEENLKRVAVDLRPYAGKEIFIRIVDHHSGHWGHINFDDFRFHAEKPNLPARRAGSALPAPDVYRYAGLPPDKAAGVMTVPEGFRVTLFAGEPDIVQPIAMCIDDRGRLWVAEAMIYPQRFPARGPLLPEEQRAKGDRILIFEDTKGTGTFDKKTVFMEGLNLVSGLEVGFGGVWIGAAPYLMFVPMNAGEDKPAGPPQILLDGWHYEDTHETLNTFTWGPDGWLYGCHGVFTYSLVGKPGTPPEKRTPINAGVWRYHPIRHEFEVFAQGTSNPWGLDFNEYGEAFIEACVIPHCFHLFEGGRYQRQAGQHFNPYTYADIQTIADHLHYVGPNPHGGNNRSDSAGGGHAHCGLMCYLGGAWPEEYRGQLFMGNIHGRRINLDILKPNGSGYTASHHPDFLLANDAWARFINMHYGPDGNAYLIDWYDKQACHLPQPEVWDRSNGRIYKVSYQGTKPVVDLDLQKCSDDELVQYQLNANDWYVRHAIRILQERFGSVSKNTNDASLIERRKKVDESLRKMAASNSDDTRRLRAIWAINAINGATDEFLNDKSPNVQAWVIRLAQQTGHGIAPDRLANLAAQSSSPVVRRAIASAAQQVTFQEREPILEGLVSHPGEDRDPNLLCMIWYALEPLAGESSHQQHALEIAASARSNRAQLVTFTARRIASDARAEGLELLAQSLIKWSDGELDRAIVVGMREALAGRSRVVAPKGWLQAFAKLSRSNDADVRSSALALSVTFGDKAALDTMRHTLLDSNAPFAARSDALVALMTARDAELPKALRQLLTDANLRASAIRAMARYDDAESAAAILNIYSTLNAADKRDAIATLASRPSYALLLLKAIGDKAIPGTDVSADIIRQLRNLRNADIDKQIATVWGIVRATPADRLRMMAQYRVKILDAGPAPDLMLGRAIFAKTCQQCHTLFGIGGKVGPDITGGNRMNLNYLLENILDPSAVIPKDYVATRIDLRDGRVVTGIVRERNPSTVTVVTATETLTIARDDIETMAESNTSMMPEDQLKPFSDHDVRSLIGYLQSPNQVPMLATPENAKDLFNGKDLTGWIGDPKLWSVQNGEIVGKSPGIKHNQFLMSHLAATDFRLSIKVKLVPNKENSGVQFRSEAVDGGEMRGPQADVGQGWWGKLYEENGRGLIWQKSGEPFVKVDDWNEYLIVAEGAHIKTWINGHLCVDLNDEKVSRRGIFGLQIHSGGPMEVRFKDIKFEVVAPQQKK
jgi:putative membrane-bound dehydrogenase-like protein